MENLPSVKARVASMSQIALTMWEQTFQAFMDHDLDLFPAIFAHEDQLNALEKELTAYLIQIGRSSTAASEKAQALIYADIVGDLELIGDYCKDILERVQIKIEEKLLFSDDAVEEYVALYERTRGALHEVVQALLADAPSKVKDVLKKEEHIDTLVDEYRKRHNERLLAGVCSPFACNMFLNMLDFTAAVYYHTKKIARNLQKIKK